jgi:hypothetical protein
MNVPTVRNNHKKFETYFVILLATEELRIRIRIRRWIRIRYQWYESTDPDQVRAKTLRIRNNEHSKIDVFPSSLCMVR